MLACFDESELSEKEPTEALSISMCNSGVEA